jgi:hypothetical protein
MNPNYVVLVKHDLDKLLVVGFISPIKEATSGFLPLWRYQKGMGSSKFAWISGN